MSELKARRGDLIVVERIERSYTISHGSSERTRYDVMEVAGLFRDGRVRTVRSVAWKDSYTQEIEGKRRMLGLVQTYLLPATDIDKEAAIKAVREHTYPNSTTPMPFDSLDEIRALLRPFRTAVPA